MANFSTVGVLAHMLAHGGALQEAMRQYGGAPDEWLDLSTGINPNPAPIPAIDPLAFERLPEAHQYDATLDAAKAFYGARGFGLLAAGTQPIIAQLPLMIGRSNAQILGPTYGEYARVLSEAQVPFKHVDRLDKLSAPWCFVVNPDNPSGRKLTAKELVQLAENCAQQGGCLVADEAFADIDGADSIAAFSGMDGLLVLRSFGKFFGLAGIRLAAAFGPKALIDAFKLRIGPWPVSGPALVIGDALYRDEVMHSTLRRSIKKAHDQTRDALVSFGFELVGDAGLFLTVKHAKADQIHERLKQIYVLTRCFDYQPEWLRFGLCKNEQDVNKLIQRLNVLNQHLDI